MNSKATLKNKIINNIKVKIMNYIGSIKILARIDSVYEDKDGNLFFKNSMDGRLEDANWIDRDDIFKF